MKNQETVSIIQAHAEIVHIWVQCHKKKKEWQTVTVAETEAKFTHKTSLSTSYLRLVTIFLSFLQVWVSRSLLQINDKDVWTSFQWLETCILETYSYTSLSQAEFKGFQEAYQAIYILDEKQEG